MLLNIRTGYNGVTKRSNEEIVVIVSSATEMAKNSVNMVFTDRHASAMAAWKATYAEVANLLDWDILQRHDFSRDDAYPDKRERYQAEALAHRHVPVEALLGIGCCSYAVAEAVSAQVKQVQPAMRIVTRENWFFA
jgi:hypothetical protein